MKFCLNYKRGSKYLEKAEEININFHDKLSHLLDFLIEHSEQRINLCIYEYNLSLFGTKLKELKDIIEKENYPSNLWIKLPKISEETLKMFTIIKAKYGIPCFFDEHASEWETFRGLIDLGVSDIYVTENLLFEVNLAAEIAHPLGIQLRTFPNVCQKKALTVGGLTSAFIRPEDIEFYSQYIDVCEFFFDKQGTEEVYYRIYAIQKKWIGNLDEIIIGLTDSIDNKYIIPVFAERRVRCGQKCLKGKKCDICKVSTALAHTLSEHQKKFEKF